MTAAANVVVAAGQNGPVMGQRGIVAHQAHRVGIGFGPVVLLLHRDGGGRLGVGLGLRGVGGIFVLLGVVPNYGGSGTPASAATTAASTTTTAAVSTSAAAGHACIVSGCDGGSARAMAAGRLLAARFLRLRHSPRSPQPFEPPNSPLFGETFPFFLSRLL